MIRYDLVCDNAHEFEGWFGSSEDFGRQQERGLVSCPSCGSPRVSKRLMAPSVSTARKKEERRHPVMTAHDQQAMDKAWTAIENRLESLRIKPSSRRTRPALRALR